MAERLPWTSRGCQPDNAPCALVPLQHPVAHKLANSPPGHLSVAARDQSGQFYGYLQCETFISDTPVRP